MHILIVEDNPDLVANLYDFFEGKGHTIDVAYEGKAGLQFALSERYDAIILDLALPGLDGIEICGRLRDAGREVPILMLTARDTLDDKLEGFTSGADDYLVKPFSLLELEARLTALVRRARGGPRQRRLKVGDLLFDPASLTVERAGRLINLPPIPLKILGLLMRHPQEVITRKEIEREIWGDSPPDSDALRAHIHVLRNAIDKPFDIPLLDTVHGIGYRIRHPDRSSSDQ